MAALDFTSFIRSESARFAEALAAADPSARVPSCPDWDAGDLLWHLTEVQLFWAVIVRDRLSDPKASDDAKPARADSYAGLLDGFADATTQLLDALAVPDGTTVWTWFDDDQSVGFVRRRQAHEALIHRLDAELTAGQVTGFDTSLASDGVDEAVRIMFSGTPAWASFTATGGTGRIVAADTGAQWDFELGTSTGTNPCSGNSYTDEPGLRVRTDLAAPQFTVTGPARDLDAWLWGRPTLTELQVIGDQKAYRRFQDVIAPGIN